MKSSTQHGTGRSRPDVRFQHEKADFNSEHLHRLRRICLSLPGATEKLSHGEPTFFANKKVFAMFSNNHHNDGHIAVWIPAAPGMQPMLIKQNPRTYYRPPYVGVRGWIGVEFGDIDVTKTLPFTSTKPGR